MTGPMLLAGLGVGSLASQLGSVTKAGKSVEQSCYSVGSGAITDTEDVKDCEVGWSLG